MVSEQKRSIHLERQVVRMTARLALLQRRSERLTAVRLALFALGGVVSGVVFVTWGAWPWLLTLLPLFIPFALAVWQHRRLETAVLRHTLWLRHKRTQVARLRHHWEALPVPAAASPPPDHPFARDFDLLGERSLHHWLQTAVSAEGSQRLADWLLNPNPDLATAQQRQALVRELRPKAWFRDKLLLNAQLHAADAQQPWAGQQLLRWLQQESIPGNMRPVLWLLGGLALLNGGLLLGSFAFGWPNWWIGSWLLYVLISLGQARQVPSLFKDAWFAESRLRQLTAVFHHLEQFCHAPDGQLTVLVAPFQQAEKRPSQQLRQVSRIAAAAALQQNPMLWLLLNLFLPWDLYFGYRLQQAKQQLRHLLPAWLDCWYELEALGALANFGYLNPSATFPSFAPENGRFCATQLAHPLIPTAERIGNDFRVDNMGDLFVLTGSNMSGKSSFLRTLGSNLCLAYAGAPVLAQSLQTEIFRPFAAIRVSDSVVDGFSYFYAEVRRLRALLDALEAESTPLFFLIDEIFRGTNNRERLLGSRAFIQALAGKNGVGVIATHDLELVQLADEFPTIHNIHFRDDVAEGRMWFDYKLRPGPSPTTNALKIMALAGLPVPEG